MTAQITYLECVEPTTHSHKFYEVAVEDCTVTIRYGRIGTQGRTQAQIYATSDLALQAAEHKLKEKRAKGYQGRSPEITSPEITSPEIMTSEPIALPLHWRFDSGFSSFGLAIEGEFCWLGNEKGRICKIDAQGQLVLQYQLPAAVKAIVVDDFWIYAGCDNGNVYDLTGKFPYVVYDIEARFDIFGLDIWEGHLGVTDANGGLTYIDPEGEIVWSRLGTGKQGWMICGDRQGFYHGHSKGVTLLEREMGRQIWHQDTLGKVLFGCQSATDLHVATTGKRVYRFRKTGELVQTYECGSSVYACAVNDRADAVFAADNSGLIYCFDQQGVCRWRAKTGCGSALSMQWGQGDRLYLATNQRVLLCADVSAAALGGQTTGDQYQVATTQTTAVIQPLSAIADQTMPSHAGVLLGCVREGQRLRVRVLSEGYEPDWYVQFPRHLRHVGDRYWVSAVKPSQQGHFYRIQGEIQRLSSTV